MEKTMAERFVAAYREWADLSPEQHEQTGNNFTDFSDFLRAKVDAAGGDSITYIQWWNCRPCKDEDGPVGHITVSGTVSRFSVIEFDDGSFAFSPAHVEVERCERVWLAGRPA